MRLTQISPHAFQLTQYKLVNCYFVRESDGLTLIDTGIRGDAANILHAARDCGDQICRVLLTHAHSDHVAGLDSLTHLLGQVDVAISRRDARLLQSPPDMSLDPGELSARLRGGYPGAHSTPTHFIEDGELYGSLRALATPGHTPGHMSFFDERDGTLYAGDALISVGSLRVVSDAHWYFPNLFSWDNATALKSAERLAQLPIHRFACGHGKVREGGELLPRALQHARKKRL